MKIGSKLAILVFILIAIAHFLRVVYGIDLTVSDWSVPQWVSVLGTIVPLVIAWLLWSES